MAFGNEAGYFYTNKAYPDHNIRKPDFQQKKENKREVSQIVGSSNSKRICSMCSTDVDELDCIYTPMKSLPIEHAP